MKKTTIDLDEMNYVVTEELKTLRTNLLFCGSEKQVIMVTSSYMSEGKSTTAVRLATSLATLQKSVLLIDLDLRKSVLPVRVHASGVNMGMSHFLSGQCELDEAIMKTNIPGFYIAFAGRLAPNPTELISSAKFKNMLASLRKLYDYIILDVPPLGMVVDAAIVAQECDGAIMVIQSGQIKYRLAQEVKRKIESAGCPVLGVVLTKVKTKEIGHYYGRYYGKYYGKYYGHEENEKE